MAKKYEFKPDKPRSGLLNRLYLTQKQRRALFKWLFYGLFLLALSVLQDVLLCRVQLLGATTELVPCGIFLVCLAEGLEQGSIFSLVAACLYLFITALAIFVTLFRQSFLRKGFSAAMLCTVVAVFVYELAVFFIGVFLGLTTLNRIGSICMTAVYTVLTAPVMYPVVAAISNYGGEAWKE